MKSKCFLGQFGFFGCLVALLCSFFWYLLAHLLWNFCRSFFHLKFIAQIYFQSTSMFCIYVMVFPVLISIHFPTWPVPVSQGGHPASHCLQRSLELELGPLLMGVWSDGCRNIDCLKGGSWELLLRFFC